MQLTFEVVVRLDWDHAAVERGVVCVLVAIAVVEAVEGTSYEVEVPSPIEACAFAWAGPYQVCQRSWLWVSTDT